MICTATFGNGAGTGMATIRAEASPIQRGRRGVRSVSAAAAAGAASPGSAVRLTATGSTRASAATAWASALPLRRKLAGSDFRNQLVRAVGAGLPVRQAK